MNTSDITSWLERLENSTDPARLAEVAALHAACQRYAPVPHLRYAEQIASAVRQVEHH